MIGLGSFTFNKRPLFAVQCIAAIPKERRPKLVWVGNSGKLEEVKQEAAKLEVDLEVHLLISDEKLRDLLSRAAVMLYTSHLEPFGYAPLEANACGKPVVGGRAGGVVEAVQDGHNGLLVNGDNVDSIVEAVCRLLEDQELYQRLRTGGIQIAQRSGWRLRTQQFQALCARLV